MKQERAKRKAEDIRKADYAEMAEKRPDERALDKFKRKPYQAAVMLREQGKQMEHKSLGEYLAERYDIRKGVDAGGQRNPD